MVNSLCKKLWTGRKTENVMKVVLWIKKKTGIFFVLHMITVRKT